MKECTNCKAQIEDDAIYCGECGTKQETSENEAQVEEPIASEEKFCIHCGKAIEADSAYCPFCGEAQDVADEVEEEAQSEPEAVTIEDIAEKEPEQAAEPEPQEETSYEWEEESSSKKWIWTLLILLLVAGGAWYMYNDLSSNSLTPVETMDNDVADIPEDVGEILEDFPTSELDFLEQFYKGNINDEEYIKQNVTANVLNKLKRDYDKDCPSGDCLATWVFTAYPPGSDLYLEEGPIISKSEGKYSVLFKYYDQGHSGRIYKNRGLLLSVTQIDGKYLIADYELVMPDIVENQDGLTNNKDGQYYLRDGRLFLHLIKKGSEIEGDFNFRDGTYVSASYEFSCLLDENNKFCTDVYGMNGKKSGMIEGAFENGVMKVDVGVDNKYSGTYELKVDD